MTFATAAGGIPRCLDFFSPHSEQADTKDVALAYTIQYNTTPPSRMIGRSTAARSMAVQDVLAQDRNKHKGARGGDCQ
jgi:hypothetical protein